MKLIPNWLRSAFGRKQQRGYADVSCVTGGINADWPVSILGEDGDLWRNAWALTSRVRDLFRTNTTYQSYRETFWANVYGADGIMLRSTVKETEDRVVKSPDERAAIRAYEERRNRVGEFLCSRAGVEWKSRTMMEFTGVNGSRIATVKVGEPDIYARTIIERRWKEWQQAKYADVRGTRNYHAIRQLRGISAVRDGDFFIRMIRNPGVNKFGFTLQLINAEWCDNFLNYTLENGNVIRRGIEYQMTAWGIGKVVAYYFIKRTPSDWQFSSWNGGAPQPQTHERIDAREIIHCARPVDADGTRPAPWVASTIPKARQLDQYELAEVVAAREQATKLGFYYSDVVAEGGYGVAPINPANALPTQRMGPGDKQALPYGVKYQQIDPTHPNGNAEAFRKMMLRSQCAGMPGSSYPTMAHDYEAINFSAGRLARLDSNELFKMIQQWDIDVAENPIFEAWLEMSLITKAIPLPLSKLEKFNSKTFQGRRWRGVDEVKEAQAAALRIANKLSSRTRENADVGNDFEEICFELAEEEMMLTQFGLKTETTVETPAPAEKEDGEADAKEDSAESENEKPKAKEPKARARKTTLKA